MAARHKIVPAAEHAKLGAFLRARRELTGVSQRDLAKRLNLPQSYVSKIERGERQLQALELLIILDAIGIPAHEFVRDYVKQDRKR